MDTARPRRDELLTRVMDAWRAFRAAAFALDPPRLEQRTPAGWTYKEMLAHVAAWHDLTARRLRVFAETGAVEPASGADAAQVFEELGFRAEDRDALVRDWHFDRFNAAVVAAAKDRDAGEVLRSLDDSFAHVGAAIAALTDEQAAAHVEDGRSFVYALVEGNTFGHYGEHAGELAA